MKQDIFITNDLSIAAFLLTRGKKIVSAGKDKNSGKYIFEFEDSDGDCRSSSLLFLSSECAVYDSHMRTLRGMLRNS